MKSTRKQEARADGAGCIQVRNTETELSRGKREAESRSPPERASLWVYVALGSKLLVQISIS